MVVAVEVVVVVEAAVEGVEGMGTMRFCCPAAAGLKDEAHGRVLRLFPPRTKESSVGCVAERPSSQPTLQRRPSPAGKKKAAQRSKVYSGTNTGPANVRTPVWTKGRIKEFS